ncbi:MAG: hypothetical protein KDC26_04825 [Armatimonadetes bacterium]|nr:hypothetical protein [Armatimonadota bacterium]
MEKKENVEAELRELMRKEGKWQAFKDSPWMVVIPLVIGITFVGSLYYSRFNGIAWWVICIGLVVPIIMLAGWHIEGLQQNKVEKLAEDAEQIDTESILALAENWHAARLINLFFVRRFEKGLPVSYEMFVERPFGAINDADWQNARVLERDICEIFAELYRVHQIITPTSKHKRNRNISLVIIVAILIAIGVATPDFDGKSILLGVFPFLAIMSLQGYLDKRLVKKVEPELYDSIRTKVFALPFGMRHHLTSLEIFTKYMPKEILNEEASVAHQ